MKENELISDPNFGIRWKNGAADRRMKGDGLLEEDLPVPVRKYVPANEMFVFINQYLMKMDSLYDLMVKNTMIIESINDGDMVYYNRMLSEVMDVDCSDVKESEFAYFVYKMKSGLLRNAATVFNSMATAGLYAKFTGEKEGTIRKWMERGKLDIFPIAGVRFIMITEAEMVAWNQFLMEECMRKDISLVDAGDRKKVVELYRKIYGKQEIEPADLVAEWIKTEQIYPEREGVSIKYKYQTSHAYARFCSFTGCEEIPLRVFSARVAAMGFARFNSRTRGFYYWRKV